jgi:hypothetical protein
VEGAAISPTGDVFARDLVSWGSIPQTSPRVARGGQSVVVWSELDIQSGRPTLRYSILGETFTGGSGSPIDVVPLGADYLIVWQDSGRTRAAILTSDLTWSEVTLPLFSGYSDIAAAANRDHWLIAGSMGGNVVTAGIAHDGTVSPATVVAPAPYVIGLASDGSHFFLSAPQRDFILDAAGSPILEKQPHGNAFGVDFAGGVYGALGGLGTLDRYDRDGNYLGSTKYSAGYADPRLSHIGSRFVIVDANIYEPRASIVGADGTLLARDLAVPDVMIAKTDATTSAAVETRSVTDTWGRPTPALFVETVSIPDTPPHRAVKH